MTLDITQVYSQIEAMAGYVKSHQPDYAHKLKQAITTLKSIAEDQEKLRNKIESARTTWLVAGLKENVTTSKKATPCPADFAVVASDGSHIDVDRHHSPRLFLLNIGLVYLQYGDQPDAEFSTFPIVYYGDDMQTIRSGDGRQTLIEGPLLGMKRGVDECRYLADSMCNTDSNIPAVGLIDGSLIMWGLVGQRYEDYVVHQLLDEGFLKQLDRFYSLSKKKRAAVASYISFPRSTEIVNVLRLQICPYDPVDCDKYCGSKYEGRPCDVVSGLLDRDIFEELLANEERSALFTSRSSIIDRYGIHQVCFFYIKLDEEVARVEVPLWAADPPQLMELVHTVIIDQCNKGFGYPVSLSEAHEQAVVTGQDRQVFWDLVDRVMMEEGMEIKGSLKQRSKKIRWI
jgi:hypothetical protein